MSNKLNESQAIDQDPIEIDSSDHDHLASIYSDDLLRNIVQYTRRCQSIDDIDVPLLVDMMIDYCDALPDYGGGIPFDPSFSDPSSDEYD